MKNLKEFTELMKQLNILLIAFLLTIKKCWVRNVLSIRLPPSLTCERSEHDYEETSPANVLLIMRQPVRGCATTPGVLSKQRNGYA